MKPQTFLSENWTEWVSMLSIMTCPFCRQQHGKIKSVHQRWLVYPPAHPNCHCIIEKLQAIEAGNATNRGNDGADWHLAHTGELPDYYIDKHQAQDEGWRRREGNLSTVLPGMMIGGDIFHNSEGKLPEAPNRIWREADINYTGGARNSERILYSNDGLIFVTYDHYQTFFEIV